MNYATFIRVFFPTRRCRFRRIKMLTMLSRGNLTRLGKYTYRKIDVEKFPVFWIFELKK